PTRGHPRRRSSAERCRCCSQHVNRSTQHRSFAMTPLRQRMLEDMGIRNFAANTQRSYLQYVSAFARHFHRSPDELGPEQVRAFQLHLSKTRQLTPGTLTVATAALRFLYKVTLKQDWAVD